MRIECVVESELRVCLHCGSYSSSFHIQLNGADFQAELEASSSTPAQRGTILELIDADGQTITAGADSFRFDPSNDVFDCVDKVPAGDDSGYTVQSCSKINFQIGPTDGAIAPGNITFRVDNGNLACQAEYPDLFEIIREPVISYVDPHFCFDQGSDLVIRGEHFRDTAFTRPYTMKIWLVNAESGVEYEPDLVLSITATEIVVRFVPRRVLAGFYHVKLQNGPECATVSSSPLVHVHPRVFALFVDPEIVYNGIDTEVTVYSAGLIGPAAQMTIFKEGQPDYEFFNNSNISTGDNANRPRIKLPVGMAAGKWSAKIISNIGCVGIADESIVVTDENSIEVVGVDPKYIWSDSGGAIAIASVPAPTVGAFNFQGFPRVYISAGDSGGVALLGMALISKELVTAIVPAGVPPGVYDLIVIESANSRVGVLEKALTVTVVPPPEISSVVPGSITAAGGTAITVTGSNFVAPTLRLSCTSPLGITDLKAVTIGSVAPSRIIATAPDAVAASVSLRYLLVAV